MAQIGTQITQICSQMNADVSFCEISGDISGDQREVFDFSRRWRRLVRR
ncbi:MAG: hypothetical protein IPK57_17465 [Chitinophagaceae bacterium]|nr:hypothetical protein [Chitinophagaceae bacterium]